MKRINEQPAAGSQVAFASLNLDGAFDDTDTSDLGKELRAATPVIDGLQVEIGGQALAEFSPPETEVIGLSFAIVILLVSFGSVLAMGLPIGTAVAGVAIGGALITLLSNVFTVPEFAPFIGVMIGLGVGIDYALFIVTRYRNEIHYGTPQIEAAGIALDTAGRAVLFAGITVVVSLLGMMIIGLEFVSGLGIAAATTVAVTMPASITLVPALLGFAGDRIEVTRRRVRRPRAARVRAAEEPQGTRARGAARRGDAAGGHVPAAAQTAGPGSGPQADA